MDSNGAGLLRTSMVFSHDPADVCLDRKYFISFHSISTRLSGSATNKGWDVFTKCFVGSVPLEESEQPT